MGIAWLWFYTHSANPDVLRTNNENRVFTVHSRWRSVIRWIGSLYIRFRRSREERAGSRELQALSDHLLRDVGLLRIGREFQLEKPYQVSPLCPLLAHVEPMPGERPVACRVVPCEAKASVDTPNYEVPDNPPRAA